MNNLYVLYIATLADVDLATSSRHSLLNSCHVSLVYRTAEVHELSMYNVSIYWWLHQFKEILRSSTSKGNGALLLSGYVPSAMRCCRTMYIISSMASAVAICVPYSPSTRHARSKQDIKSAIRSCLAMLVNADLLSSSLHWWSSLVISRSYPSCWGVATVMAEWKEREDARNDSRQQVFHGERLWH